MRFGSKDEDTAGWEEQPMLIPESPQQQIMLLPVTLAVVMGRLWQNLATFTRTSITLIRNKRKKP